LTEVITGEFSKYRSNLLDIHQSMKVRVWDTGPEKPVPPARPVPAKVLAGTIEHDIEAIALREAVANYEKLLGSYVTLLRDHDGWHSRHSGPVVFEQWSCDAADTFRHDGRSVAEGRTRARRYYKYDARAPRMGLPVGVEPGASHREQVMHQAAQAEAAEAARKNDPFFGDAA
jgi:hypothetical protein